MDDFEGFENLTNSTFEHDVTGDQTTYNIFWEIVLVIVCIFGIFVDSLIAYTIFRFKKLKTVPNILIANWSVADIFLLIALHNNYRIVDLFEDLNHFTLVFIYESEFIFRNNFMVFVMALTIDWFLASYFSRTSQKFRKLHKFIIGFIWISTLISLFVSLGLHLNNIYCSIPKLFSFYGYFAFLIFIIALYSFRGVQKCRKKSSEYPTLMLTLTTILMVCWIPLWPAVGFSDIIYKYFWPLLECCDLAPSVVTFIVLFRSNKDFQACFQQAVKCSRNRYENEISEFQGYPENVNIENHPPEPNLNQNGRG